MKKIALLLSILCVFALFAGCAQPSEPVAQEQATQDQSTQDAQEQEVENEDTQDEPAQPSGDNGETKEIALIIKNQTNPYWIDYISGLQDACEEFGFNSTVFANQAETDIEEQIELCNTVLSQGFDLMVVSPQDSTAIAPVVMSCNEQGVPIFIVDTAADKEATDALGAKVDYFVTGEDYMGGKMAAQMMVDALDGTGNVAILEGLVGSSTAIAIQDGITEIFEANPGINVATSETANWSRTEGYDVTTNILAAHPDLNGLIAANEEMAQGAIQAIEAAGLTGNIKIVTLNYTDESVETMNNGLMYGTVDKGPYRQGYQAIVRANDYFNGVEIPAEEKVPPLAYIYTDPENASPEYDVEDFR